MRGYPIPALICFQNAQALFESSSEFLHKATHGRVYFKKVIIELPHTWPKRANAWAISESTFTRSDVRVELPIAACGDQPSTSQVDGCGYPGDFIHLTPGFLAKTQNMAAQSKLLGGKLEFLALCVSYLYLACERKFSS
ncbi:hypothetical protein HPB48_021524 [Haemaphysalis longicornis]|uniref:Calcium-activated chloride channel N-terminal domain-containing protein n=1 Tax=Haemaphysalis longicornis TaxID=44386 RepID=A0A9J6FLP1_HAELO|nr:hypothetical protein HPB48_021524 [Haemaphysalis longicornis]